MYSYSLFPDVLVVVLVLLPRRGITSPRTTAAGLSVGNTPGPPEIEEGVLSLAALLSPAGPCTPATGLSVGNTPGPPEIEEGVVVLGGLTLSSWPLYPRCRTFCGKSTETA